MSLVKEFRSDMQKRELILTFSTDKALPDYYEKMVRYNHIPGLLKFRTDMSDGVRRFVYNADGLRPLTLEYEKWKPGYEGLKNVLYDIMESIEESRRYLISEDDFVICDDCIFLDDAGNAFVTCLPGFERSLKEQFSALFDFFRDKIDYRDKSAVVALYDIYRKSRENECDFEYIRKVFGKRERKRSGEIENSRLSVDCEPAVRSDCDMKEILPEVSGFPEDAGFGHTPKKPSEDELLPAFPRLFGNRQGRKKRSLFGFLTRDAAPCGEPFHFTNSNSVNTGFPV